MQTGLLSHTIVSLYHTLIVQTSSLERTTMRIGTVFYDLNTTDRVHHRAKILQLSKTLH